ncbi:MAG: tetratricopeptide repeat protein [Desulfobacteraceae bacterium]|nr:tetratricopeptide repeat protein [Desulfobacteraceae bacterium]
MYLDMTHAGSIEIQTADFVRLAPLLIGDLRTKFPFSEGRGVLISSGRSAYDEVLSAEALSERQLMRAREALSRGDAFSYRAGLKVFLPVCRWGNMSGLLILSGVSRTVGPEEECRLLPIVKAYAWERLRAMRMETSVVSPGEPPLYITLCIERPVYGDKDASSFLHLIWDGGTRGVSKSSARIKRYAKRVYDRDDILNLCARLWPEAPPEWIGANSHEAWVHLPGISGPELSMGLKDIVCRARKAGLFLIGIYGHTFTAGPEPGFGIEAIKKTETAARRLGVSVISSHDLYAFEKRLGARDIGEGIAAIEGALNGGKNAFLAFARPVSPGCKKALPDGAEIIDAGPESAFIVQKLSRDDKNSRSTQDWALSVQERLTPEGGRPCTIGAYKLEGPAALARPIYAYLHAALLGDGSSAVFDAVTLNVWGDELFSWGDIVGALKAYRMGLKIDSSSANLLNSIGVCLARLGKANGAADVFLRAIELFPEGFMAYFNLGGLFFDMGRVKEAGELLSKAYGLEPGDIRTAVRFAEVLLEEGKKDAAEEVMGHFAGADSRQDIPCAVFRVMGRVAYHGRGGWRMARDAWLEALRRNPADAESLACLALGYLENDGDAGTARRLLRQAKAVDSARRHVKRLLGTVERRLTRAPFKENKVRPLLDKPLETQ